MSLLKLKLGSRSASGHLSVLIKARVVGQFTEVVQGVYFHIMDDVNEEEVKIEEDDSEQMCDPCPAVCKLKYPGILFWY